MDMITTKIKRHELDEVMELYHAFGYEFINTAPAPRDDFILVNVKRNNKKNHNKKVVKLENQFNFLLRKHPFTSYPWMLIGIVLLVLYIVFIKNPYSGFLLAGSIFTLAIGLFIIITFLACRRKRKHILSRLVSDAKDLSGTHRSTPIFSNITKAVSDTGNIRKHFNNIKK